jgi:deoxyinosine 3'endonuclease (endonuclease V)
MIAKARMEHSYKDEETAKMVARLLDLDNKIADLNVRTFNDKKKVITTLEHENLGTFFATIDDLIFTEKLISSLLESMK